MEKKFEIQKFERLECSSEVLKGGFSPAYAGGGIEIKVGKLNIGYCPTTINNNVAGCGCEPATPTTPTEPIKKS
jgi:hypothetical protein